jgi:(S)-citramalyl-CoA lyase
VVTLPQLQKSICSLKSGLFTPATTPDRFAGAAEVNADTLILNLEEAVARPKNKEGRRAALRSLAVIPTDHFPFAPRINYSDTRSGFDDPQALLSSRADPNYLILQKCEVNWERGSQSTANLRGLCKAQSALSR